MVQSQKTDSLFHVNGNILLGEIKKLDYGQLAFKMDGMGTVTVDVDKISSIKSDKFFEFTTSHGRTIYGFIDSTSIQGMININSGYDSSNFHLYQIVEIYPIKNTFFLRTSGKINMGFNYTKASDIGRFNVDWNLQYRNKGSLVSLTGSNVQTFSPNDTAATSSKYDLYLNFEKKISGVWSWSGNLGGSQNTELGLYLRLKGGLGILGDVYHTNSQRLYVLLGVAPNMEISEQQANRTSNFEGQASISYQIYRYTFPEISLNTKFDLYPSFNNSGRYRVDYNIDVNIEVFDNFYVGGKFYYNFDSKPPSDNASNNDYGFTTTLGYSFH